MDNNNANTRQVLDAAILGSGERMLKYFVFGHLPANLQDISAPFGALAATLVGTLPSSAERTVALRKLLEAKDCAVRAALEG